jgi:hypothetical protein
MKRKRALELQREWAGKPCAHPAFAKEYDLGVRTGNFVCTRCGVILSPQEKVRLMIARRESEPAPED